MPPLLSEQAAFAKHLFVQGYPLWTPFPDLLPPERQNDGLKIGDVGIVDDQGRFDLFFNIYESRGSDDSPSNLPSIEVGDIRRRGGDLPPHRAVSSPATSWNIQQSDMIASANGLATSYRTTFANDGAHVILPRGAQFFELKSDHQELFEQYVLENGANWLKQYKSRLRASASNSIYVLTGLYQTCSWSVASFSMQGAADTNPVHVCCTLMEEDERIRQEHSGWDPTGRFEYKIGPPPDSGGGNNQTVFIRGFTVTPNRSKPGPGEQREAGLLSWLSSTWFPAPGAGDSTKAAGTETAESDVLIQRVPQTSRALHPSEIINQYLFTQEPSAKIAVTHDSRWIKMLDSLGGEQSWTLEDLAKNVKTSASLRYSIVTRDDTVYLRDAGTRLPTVEQVSFSVDSSDDPDLRAVQHSHSSLSDAVYPSDAGTRLQTVKQVRFSVDDSDGLDFRAAQHSYSSLSDTDDLDFRSDCTPESRGPITPPQNNYALLPVPHGPIVIHPVLAFHPFVPSIIYDTSLPPHTLAPNVHAPSLSFPASVLEEVATQPGMHSITLLIDQFPWRLTIPPTKHYVSVRALLEALYSFLRQSVVQSEYNALPSQALKDEVSIAFHNRCARAPAKGAADEQYQKGLKRVDFLRGRTRFMGLSSTKVGPDVWLLNLA